MWFNFLFGVAMNVSFADKIVDGFNAIFKFFGKIFGGLFKLLSSGFQILIDLLAKPLKYLLYFFEGIFYFFEKVLEVVIMVVKVFVSIFQFAGSLIMGVFRTIKSWLTVDIHGSSKFVSASNEGFKTVIDLLQPTGLLTIVPMVATAFLWFYFVIKMIGLFGGSVHIQPFGSSNNGGGDKL